MKLIVGLGNPGESYAATRHNVGFRVVDEVARRAGAVLGEDRFLGHFGQGRLDGSPVALLKPMTSMNRSGEAVLEALHGLAIDTPSDDLLILFDDLDLPLGRLRLRPRGSDGGQRGLRDVLEKLGNRDVPRLRFGVSRPPVGIDPITWVLQSFSPEEQDPLRRSLARAADAVTCWVTHGVALAMDRFNGLPEEPM